jgi:hypothetical protein
MDLRDPGFPLPLTQDHPCEGTSTRRGVAVTGTGLQVGIRGEPTADQLQQLLAAVEAPFFSGAKPFDKPGDTVGLVRGSSDPNHEVLEALRRPIVDTQVMGHYRSLVSGWSGYPPISVGTALDQRVPILPRSPQPTVKLAVKSFNLLHLPAPAW